MKRGFTQFSLMLVASITLFSCSVEKRYHSSGWNISLRKGGSDVAVAPVKKQKTTVAKKVDRVKADAEVFNEETEISRQNPGIIGTMNLKASENNSDLIQLNDEKKPTNNENKFSVKKEFSAGVNRIIKHVADDKKTNAMALTGFITGVVGLIIFGIILGIVAVVFSSIGLSKINKNPEKFSGKGFGIAGLVLGIIDILAAILLLALLI